LIDMTALLDVSDVTLRYKTSSAVVTATERVSFTVDRSDRFVLLGPSGCGKSTLLKAVGGYMTPSEGKMRISGREITEPGADRMMIFQEFDQLLPWKTVLENVAFPLKVTGRAKAAEAKQRADYARRIAPAAPLKERLQQLASVRTEEGYMAEVHPAGPGAFLFIENHCPICAAATACQGFCATELDLFRSVLGSDASVERTEHIVSGDRRCVYRVTAKRRRARRSVRDRGSRL
jgi:ABC-type histidine transport system ATPase subunit